MAATSGTTKPGLSVSQTDVREEGDDQMRKVEEDASNEEKVAALTTNIQVVLESKAKLEMSYQAEKKKFRVIKFVNL